MTRGIGGIVLVMLGLASLTTSAADQRCNIILMLVDDLGWRDLGCQGSTYYKTPHIDQLAATGTRFTNAYAACAVCSPTRAAVLTGKYPARLLLTDWLPSGRWNPQSRLREGRFIRGLPVEEFTLAEALRQQGYRTALIGKWHLGSEPFSLPEHHGFDVNIAGNAHGAPGSYFYPYAGDWLIPGTNLHATWNVLADGQQGEYLTDRLTDEAIKFIGNNRQQPFFLYLPHYAVHAPLEAQPELTAKYAQIPEHQRQGLPEYAAMIESVDNSLGRIMRELDKLQLAEQTMILFTSDNGGLWKATDHAPLRGNKGAYYEGGIRVPLIIKWPGKAQPGKDRANRVVEEPVISTDLYPTCLAAAGMAPLPNQHLDGKDLSPLVLGHSSTLHRAALYWHFPHYNDHPHSVPSSVIRKGAWKLIESFDPPGFELYNLEHDLSETQNLAQAEPDKLAELQRDLNLWRLSVDAEMMQPNPDYTPTPDAQPNKKRKKAKANP